MIVRDGEFDVLCNKCGLSMLSGDKLDCEDGLRDAKVFGTYNHLTLSSIKYKFDLCKQCLDELVSTFKIDATHKDVYP